ncbi:hypothetical protein OBK13_09560 [Empedobacter falsenii]
MKKTFILLATIIGIGCANAQSIFDNTLTKSTKIEKTKAEKLNKKIDFVSFNKATIYSSPTEAMEYGRGQKKQSTLQPFATINSQGWGFGNNVDNGETLFFGTEVKYKAGAYFQFQIYDDNLKVEKQFKISIPESANSVQVVSDFSSKILANNTKLIIPIYVHFFEGGSGPEFQKHQIWLVSETGEIVSKTDASSFEIKKGQNSNYSLFAYDNTDDEVILTKVDLNNPSQTKEYKLPFDLANFYAGIPITHKNLDGKDYLVFAHYTEKLVDNSTLEFNSNAKFVLDLIAYDTFTVEKSFKLPVFGFDEENPYTIPMATFGMFYNTDKYDISKNTYNTDNKLEFTYGSYIYDMLADQEWYNYYVVNEDGVVIHKIDEQVAGAGAENNLMLQELPNQKDQAVMMMGGPEGITNLRVYNLPDFSVAYDFPALHNDELLTLDMNRIANGTTYNYVFGMGMPEIDGDKMYGVVKHFDNNGKEVKKVKLPLTSTTEKFKVFLTDVTLNPTIINDDNEIEYVYALQDRENNQIANTYRIAQNENNIIADFSGRTEKGSITNAGYLLNRKGEYDRMYIYYGSNYSATSFLTEFYKLPMQTLSVNDITTSTQTIKYLSNLNQVRIDYDYQTYQVYSVNGNLISSGNSVQTIFTNGWNKGVYIIKTIDKQGKANTAKILVF